VAEATYLVQRKYGPVVESRFVEGLAEFEVVAPTIEDFRRMGQLMRQYADFPLGGTDASVVALAERLGTDLVITLDQRHFRAVQPRHCRAFRILPSRAGA
jgi:predicted nucleic acid-binding protein